MYLREIVANMLSPSMGSSRLMKLLLRDKRLQAGAKTTSWRKVVAGAGIA
jgi:hypothetical protein